MAKWLNGSRCRLGWSVVGRGMGVLDGVAIVEGEGALLAVNLGHPVVNNGDYVA